MITLMIRYTIDTNKLKDFETYARTLAEPIARCGGHLVGYYSPTKFAGPTNIAYGIINFDTLAEYETYRGRLALDPGGIECLRRVEAAGCILIEDRSFLQSLAD